MAKKLNPNKKEDQKQTLGLGTGMRRAILQRYRKIIVAVIIFLILDTTVLMTNVYLSFQLTEDALGVNLSGRQRMLSQRTTKSILRIERAQNLQDQEQWQNALDELKLVSGLFGTTLHGFDVGDTVTNTDNTPVYLKKAVDAGSRKAIEPALQIWQPYQSKIDRYMKSAQQGTHDAQAFNELLDYSLSNNLQLLKLMNDLAYALEHVSANRAKTLRYIQFTVWALALLNFLVITFNFLRQTVAADMQIARSREETERIMKTVREGLFLVDSDMRIGEQHSIHLEGMIGIEDLAGRGFLEVMERMVDAEALANTQTFIEELFNPKVYQDLIADLNPLKQIKVTVLGKQGNPIERYLNFQFNRVYEDKTITGVLVSVHDITQEILLKQQLETEHEESERYVQMINTIVKSNHSILRGFIDSCRNRLNKINRILESPGKNQAQLRGKANEIYREMHSIKGEASAVDLRSFVSKAESFESLVNQLRSKPRLVGDDFLGLAVILNELIDLNEFVEDLGYRLGTLQDRKKDLAVEETSINTYFLNYVEKMAQRNARKVSFECSGWEVVPEAQIESLRDISIQLLRNAVFHGIESALERTEAGKSPEGHVKLKIVSEGSYLQLSIEDDGRGLSLEKIAQKALEKGLVSEEDLRKMSRNQIIALIFSDDISTATTVTEDGGKGVGMSVILDRVREIRGKLSIATREGKMTRFSIILPKEK